MINRDLKALQLSVFLENRAGCLAKVVELLAAGGINLRATSLAETSEFGILRFMADDMEKAERLLSDQGFATGRTYVTALEIDDRPGSLAKLLGDLAAHDVNVEYMYAFIPRKPGSCIIVFKFDKMDKAIELLRDQGAGILPATQLRQL